METPPSSGPAGTGMQIEAVRGGGGGGLRKWLRKAEHRRDHPYGLSETLAMSREVRGGHPDVGRGNRNKLAARGCRVKEGPGEQVEGSKIASARTGGGGQREWTFVQVDRIFHTRRQM